MMDYTVSLVCPDILALDLDQAFCKQWLKRLHQMLNPQVIQWNPNKDVEWEGDA